MVCKHAFDVYVPLAQEELELPLFDVIQNLNWLIGNALNFDSPRIAIFMSKYDTMLKNFPDVHQVDANGNPVTTTSFVDADFIAGYFDAMFDQMEAYPIMTSPMSMLSNVSPVDYVVETWKIITACQVLLPCVVNLKKVLERRFGKKMKNTIIICSIEEYLKRRNPSGYIFIRDIVSNAVNSNSGSSLDNTQVSELNETIFADLLLNGLTRLSLVSTHYLNMCAVSLIISEIVSKHHALVPDVLHETPLY